MDIQEESIIVARMTRLEAARTLVAPGDFQILLRARLLTMAEREQSERTARASIPTAAAEPTAEQILMQAFADYFKVLIGQMLAEREPA